MLLNYHEMTMNAPADSPDKRRQFAFICAVMVAALSYSVMTSGVMLPIEPTPGVFPGGTFCYKLTHRDYAASMGLGNRVTKDAIGSEKSTGVQRREVEKVLYHMFFDNPSQVGGRYLRWATGILVPDSQKETVDKLLSLNTHTGTKATTKRYPTESELMDLTASEIFEMLPYEVATLPTVDALVVQFPHTHGFVSALVISYKIIPALQKLSIENGGSDTNPIVISTCRKDEEMCTFYVPLAKTETFLLGLPNTTSYQKSLPNDNVLSWESLKQGARKLVPSARKYIDMLP